MTTIARSPLNQTTGRETRYMRKELPKIYRRFDLTDQSIEMVDRAKIERIANNYYDDPETALRLFDEGTPLLSPMAIYELAVTDADVSFGPQRKGSQYGQIIDQR